MIRSCCNHEHTRTLRNPLGSSRAIKRVLSPKGNINEKYGCHTWKSIVKSIEAAAQRGTSGRLALSKNLYWGRFYSAMAAFSNNPSVFAEVCLACLGDGFPEYPRDFLIVTVTGSATIKKFADSFMRGSRIFLIWGSLLFCYKNISNPKNITLKVLNVVFDSICSQNEWKYWNWNAVKNLKLSSAHSVTLLTLKRQELVLSLTCVCACVRNSFSVDILWTRWPIRMKISLYVAIGLESKYKVVFGFIFF